MSEIGSLVALKQILSDLHEAIKHPLHTGQVKVAHALFQKQKKTIFVQCGRRWGKTEAVIYACWRWALTRPGSQIYIIAPQRKQAREIYWTSGRLKNYGPEKYVEKSTEQEMRLVFNNGSFIVVDGAENYETLRGITPDLVVYEEFKDHCREFDIEVIEPALATKEAPVLIIGTPPKHRCYFVEKRDYVLERIKKGDKRHFYIEGPSSENPIISREWLVNKKQQLFENGDSVIWYVEYEGKFVMGGEDSIFPMFKRTAPLVMKYNELIGSLEKNKSNLRWWAAYDPATNSPFGILFGAHNPYTSELFILDELYLTDQRETSSHFAWTKSTSKETSIVTGIKWNRVCDEAAAWFRNEIKNSYRVHIGKTRKALEKKERNVSLIKDMMRLGKITFSDKCQNLFWEIEGYRRIKHRDGHYTLPDVNDHLIDALTYMVAACGFKFIEDAHTMTAPKKDRETPEQAWLDAQRAGVDGRGDWTAGIEDLPDYNYNTDPSALWN